MSYTLGMTTLSIRIEEKTKREAKKTLEALGLDLSSAVNMFLNQVVIDQGIPFKPSRISTKEEREKIRAEWDKQVKDAMKTKGYATAEEMHKAIFK
jgi:DNA-damage-inducible protein J